MTQMCLTALKCFFITLLLTSAFTNCHSLSLPDYIQACRRSDPKLDQCLVANGNKAIPYILNGDPRFNIPNLLPLNVPHINIISNNGLSIAFADCKIYGLEMATMRDMHVDFDGRHVRIDVDIATLTLLATYEINGRVMILPIQGKGPTNITFAGGEYQYEFKYDLMMRKNGHQYVKFTSNNLEYRAQRIHLHLDNLFNGDRRLGDNMNMFLNEHWRDISDELYPSLKTAISEIVTAIATGLFSKVPFADLYLV